MEASLREQIGEMAARYPVKRGALLPALYATQDANSGTISEEDLRDVAGLLSISPSQAFGVASFYTMFRRTPIGKYHLQVDTNLPATLAGAEQLLQHILHRLGICIGQTTSDGLFTVSSVEDLGAGGTCPVIQVNDRYYEAMTPEKTDRLIESLRRGEWPELSTAGYFASECNILLRRRGRPNSAALKGYVKDGGYNALAKALSMEPGAIVDAVKTASLRGRGGAGFPTGMKWGLLPKNSEKPIYLVCNADEGEPGTFKDRQIMEFDPHLLIEGMAIAGYAIGAKVGFIYIRGEFSWIAHILEKAIAEARAAGKLGRDILGSGFEFDIAVHRGAGSYICGEETALIESIEGKRGQPRVRPPFPAQAGLWGCPTIVNNVETLACVPYIIENGPDAFRKIGPNNNFGPKLFGVSGHVNRPGIFEFPMGTPLTKILDAAGGVKGEMKAVIVGGLSTPLLTPEEAKDIHLDYESCLKAGTMLGSGGIIVMNQSVSIPRMALRLMQFYAHESCGQCTPCRQGSQTIVYLLRKLLEGRGEPRDLTTIERLAATIKGLTLCPGGDAFATPLSAMLKKFHSEFDALCG
ncbi:MAG TPA: NADH-quinone oxidoreductase subunit NuoF [Candidatus Hydrogenedentes bacterium]|nr:NADH-quinone oxidoreductase subunit NuoF [Candidatus Hydrogenedentota bacterium]